MIYAIIGLVLLAGLCAWLIWRGASLRGALEKARARNHELQEDRAIRHNLQQVLSRREAEIRRLRARVAAFESDVQEMENRASDLNLSLFQESGRRILAEKEDGVKRMKMEQLEQQLSEARDQLKAQAAQAEAKLQAELARHDADAAQAEAGLRGEIARLNAESTKAQEALRAEIAERDAQIAARDAEIGRLQQLNARRLARKAQSDSARLDQVTMDDLLQMGKGEE